MSDQNIKNPTSYDMSVVRPKLTHHQDFQVKLYEYALKSNLIRWAFWLVGFTFGFGSRPLGQNK